MADQKISAMTAAAALTGAEELPLVQSGGNRKVSYATLQAALYASPGLTGTPTAPTPGPGTNTTQVPTTAWVLSEIVAALTGLSWKAPCRVATTAAGTLASSFENGDTIDGVSLATGDRILVKDQAAPAENGIYVVAASGAPARAADCDSEAELIGAAVFVTSGTANGNKQFAQTTDSPITVNTTALAWVQIGTNGGVLTDGDKGNITVSGGGTVWTIDANAVDFTQVVQIATDRLLGRDTAGTGNVETLTVGGGIEFTGSGGIRRSALTGDVAAAAGSNATTIADDAVTYAKLQNVSATSRVLGRKTTGAGDAEELTFSEVLDFVGGAGQGDILYRNATAWVRLAAGTAGHVLTTGGAGANPSWAASGGGSFVALTGAQTAAGVKTWSSDAKFHARVLMGDESSLPSDPWDMTGYADNFMTAPSVVVWDNGANEGAFLYCNVFVGGDLWVSGGIYFGNATTFGGSTDTYLTENTTVGQGGLTAYLDEFADGDGAFYIRRGSHNAGGNLYYAIEEITTGNMLEGAGGTDPVGNVFTGGILTTRQTSAAAARTALGLAIGTDVQAYDADLAALAALSGTNTIYYRSGAAAWSAVSVGSGLSFAGGTLSATGGGVSDGDKGDITVTGGGATWNIDAGAVSNSKFRTSAALSVVGNATNATAAVADIAAGANDQLLIRRSNALAFGLLVSDDLPVRTVRDLTLPASSLNDTRDDVDPGTAKSGEWVRVTAGLVNDPWTGLVLAPGQELNLVNRDGSGRTVTLHHLSTNSTKTRRFHLPGGASLSFAPGDRLSAWHDATGANGTDSTGVVRVWKW